ncbi:MAG: UDP-glucose 4-epimerase GalE [Peptococcaceae bacterium]|nr:UDP-glucose 4-epimerase GalE [Peptococcaceae bacterium]MDH7524536.1 UDP-glucose 4-epimerase GalE [Peptococcaceae bacterium]
MSVLVTGGAGYIGSHTVKLLVNKGYDVVVYDSLEKGHRDAVGNVPLVVGNVLDTDLLQKTIRDYGVTSVVHFAAYSLVGESMKEPRKYYYNNVDGTARLLNTMLNNQVKKIVFSSTAAVYGEPDEIPISEDSPKRPTSVYGKTKLIVEELLSYYLDKYGVQYVSLRYFNACGADESGELGEDHDPETHLIPLIMQTAMGKRLRLQVFGDDYPTPDGTCIRDYIHVNDLALAHVLALEALEEGKPSSVYNLGNGRGFSVKEVIETAEKVTGEKIKYEIDPRRAGDPAVLVASSEKIRRELGWEPLYTSLEGIIYSAWRWHQKHPEGFG